MTTTYGAQKHPRLLVIAGGGEPDLEYLRFLFPTIKLVDSPSEVRAEDYDVALLLGVTEKLPTSLFVLQISDYGSAMHSGGDRHWYRAERPSHSESRSSEFHSVPGLDAEISALVGSALWPRIQHDDVKSVVVFQAGGVAGGPLDQAVIDDLSSRFHPLLVDSDGNAAAAWIERDSEGHEWWSLPERVSDPLPWLKTLVPRWRESAPTAFPERAASFESAEWQTLREIAAQGAVDALEVSRIEFEQSHAAKVANAQSALSEAAEIAKTAERRLLTGTGAELEEAVADALSTVGFVVTPQDGTGGKLREDHRISPSAESNWVALVEVKGLTNGASPAVFGQVSRHEVNYAAEFGHAPDAVVIVVNHFRNLAPGDRPLVLRDHQKEVDAFAQNGYLVIDTRDLFRLARDVESGAREVEDVRQMVMETSGVLHLK